MFDDSLDTWDDDNFVAADTETSGVLPEYALQPWRWAQGNAWLTSIAWVWNDVTGERTGGGLFPDLLMIREFLQWVIDTGRVVVGWNVAFDCAWLIAMGFREQVFAIRWLDGMLIWRHLDIEPEYEMTARKKKSYSLKVAVPEFIPAEAGYEAEIDYHSTDPAELEKLQAYNIKDNRFALSIAKALYSRLKRKQRNAMWMETRCIPMVAEANLRGLLVDGLASAELSKHQKQIAERMLFELGPHGVTPVIIRSPKKLADLMFNQWRLPVLKINYGKEDENDPTAPVSENPSTDKEVLFELSLLDRRAKLLRTYREALNNDTKFASRLQQSLAYNETGAVHPQARIFGTYTGRITISSKQTVSKVFAHETKTKGTVYRAKKVDLPIGWAQHQMKRDKEFRKQVIAPYGYDMVEFDAAGQEFKWMACASMDPVMLSLCLPGEDPHSYMTAQIYRENYIALKTLIQAENKAAGDRRKMGKIGNLSLQYRTKPKRLRVTARVDYDVMMTPEEAQHIWLTYQRTYTHVPAYWDQAIAWCRATGYAETFGGRRVQLRGDWHGNFGWNMGSTAINYKIQGTGADQKYLAMSLLRDKLIEYDGYFAFDLHDGMYSFVPHDKSRSFIEDVKPLLDDLPYGPCWGYIPPVPMTWDAKIGKSWGSLRNFK